MPLVNYLIRRCLLRVKKLYLYMYMYLSDRIRRMFLSGACPQNLSPKKPLSLKDQRFLQKTKADKNLTRILVKQQKLLYEKHIGLLLQASVLKDGTANSNSKKFLQEKDKVVSNTPIYLQVCSKAQKTIKTKKGAADRAYKAISLVSKVDCWPLGSLNPKVVKGPEDQQPSVPGKAQGCGGSACFGTSQKSHPRKRESFADNIWKPLSNYNFPRKSLTLFVQSLKVQKSRDLFYMKNEKKEILEINSVLLEKGKMSKDISKLDSHAMLAKIARHALLSPGKSQYTNCRYLYDHESLKTCIVPQLFKNQKPISRAKTLLHERKKIALLYGQLAKKDILKISQKALSIPGFFEDNMFCLLESRVDVCVFRAGFSKTIAGARQLIRNGSVLVNGKKISSCKRTAKPGDYFTFKQAFLNPYRYTTLELYHLCLSSNFYRGWVFMNKMKFFRELAFKQKFDLKKIEGKKVTSKTGPEWLLFKFFAVPPTEHSKPAFCYSLYWGFFLYKLYKIPSFSCFFETKRKSNILLYALKKKLCFSGMALTQGVDPKDPAKSLNFSQALQSRGGLAKSRTLEKKKPKAFVSLCLPSVHSLAMLRPTQCFLFSLGKKKNIVLLNLYTQLLLKKKENLKTKQNSPYFLFRKNLSSSHLWAIWGQKPLHLEISHKTNAFIYMYKPQKIISPVCLNFKP